MVRRVCGRSVLLHFITGSGKRKSWNLVTAAVYLVAYLLKDLTLELFTQYALGESLTHNINLSLWLPPNCTVISIQSCLEPLGLWGPALTSTSCQGSGTVWMSHWAHIDFSQLLGHWQVMRNRIARYIAAAFLSRQKCNNIWGKLLISVNIKQNLDPYEYFC